MPTRKEFLETGNYYHVFNRGVARQDIYLSPRFYRRFERTVVYYLHEKPTIKFSRYINLSPASQIDHIQNDLNKKPVLVEIVAYCLMPNHFHLILKQLIDGGISNFVGNVSNSFTRYFNTIKNREGPIFQGPFKAKWIETEFLLSHISRYIHLNPVVSGLIKDLSTDSYPYSSYESYVGRSLIDELPVKSAIVMRGFDNGADYSDFCCDHQDYARTIHSYSEYMHDENDG